MFNIEIQKLIWLYDDKKNEIEININGVLINYKKKYYIISSHQGLPIKSISINNFLFSGRIPNARVAYS